MKKMSELSNSMQSKEDRGEYEELRTPLSLYYEKDKVATIMLTQCPIASCFSVWSYVTI